VKSKIVLCAVVCLVAVTAPQVQAQERSRAGVYALEGLGALGAAGCWGFLAYKCFDEGLGPWGVGSSWVLVASGVVSAATLPAVAGFGAAKVGDVLGEHGSTGLAIGGAYLGTVVGVGMVVLGVHLQRAATWIPACVLGGLSIPAGAVVGYNLGGRRGAAGTKSGTGRRLQAPGVALTAVELPDHSVEYGVKVQLAGLRF
jgi:hypothetical protein